MRKVLAFATLILMTSVFSLAMEKTWTGKISNSDCKSTGKKMAAHDRVIDCVEKGSKYCSQYCKDAADTMEISCNCRHAECGTRTGAVGA